MTTDKSVPRRRRDPDMRNFIYKGEGSAQPRQVKRNGSEKAAAPKDSNAKK